ncbi:carboxylesterase/lipase family protein [Ponticaulis profundi]|uniref:Carboxylic ester hydrolase n=1 Tax=Ponticaulis profundi TaxID=2665222 RepID=A0ABW1S9X5_9PROT
MNGKHDPASGLTGMPMTRRSMLAISAASAAAACATSEAVGGSTPIARTEKGKLQGERLGNVNRFLGIRYAQPINGANRFAPPKPVDAWSGVREALRYADNAPQQAADPTGGSPVTPAFDPPDYVTSGDDCLALNVWAPANTDRRLPVMVWLHGGGWTSGSGSCAIYDGQNLASRGDVVVVTINHRLGASGLTDFSRVLGGAFSDSDNLSVKDMIAALEWVRDNIQAFGGDPDLVTIFGESGGGWKVNTLLGSPAAKGLFHRAIVESGPLTRFHSHEDADEIARSVLESLGITPETADKLNSISFEDVLAAEAAVMSGAPMSFQAPGFPTGFWPVLNDTLLPEHVYDPEAVASSLDVPLMVGQTGTEFTLFMLGDKAAYSQTEAQLEQRVAGMFGAENATRILATYRRDFPDYDPSGLWFRIFSDYAMGALSSEVLDQRSISGAAAVYAYRFNWQTPIEDGKLYSPHTIEIPFVFDNVRTEAGQVMTGGGAEAAMLGKTVSEAWVTFARTGRPGNSALPDWPEYTTESRASMHLNVTSDVKPYMDADMVELFHTMLWSRAGVN